MVTLAAGTRNAPWAFPRASPVRSGEAGPVRSIGSEPISPLPTERGILRDAKRHGSGFSIASPGQQRAIGADLFQQPSADEPIHGVSKRFARNVCRQVNSAIIALRSRGQNDELGSVSLAIGILRCVGAASLPPPPQPHLSHAAGGAGSRGRVAPGTGRVPLRSRPNASPFWIMLLLVWGRLDHGMIQLRCGDSSSSSPLGIGTLHARSKLIVFSSRFPVRSVRPACCRASPTA